MGKITGGRPTPSQQRLLQFLRRREQQGHPPTYREIAAELGWKAVATARDHVRALARLGLVVPSRQARGLRLAAGGRRSAVRAEARRGWTGAPPDAPAPSEVTGEALAALRPYLRRRRFGAGVVLWQEGAAAGLVVSLERGRVAIYRALANGKEVVLYVFGPREVFGFLPFLDGGPYPASARAVEPVEALVMTRAELLEALRRSPQLALPLFGFLGRRLRDAFGQIERLSVRSALPRVAAMLAALLPPQVAPGGLTVVTLPLPAGELARTAGLTPESLSRAVTELVARGVLRRLGPRRLQVLDPAALRAAGRPGDL